MTTVNYTATDLWWLQDAIDSILTPNGGSHAQELQSLHDKLKSAHEAAVGVTQSTAGAAGGRVPDGWKLVPIEPNWDMRNEGREFLIDGLEKNPEKLAYFLWKTMVAAAPEVK